MLRHVVMFTWADDATPEQKQAVRDGLAELERATPWTRNFRFGENAGLAPDSYDWAVVVDFEDEADWRSYMRDASHQRLIVEQVRPATARRAAAQFHWDE